MKYLKSKEALISLSIGIFMLVGSFVINSFAVTYATDSISNSVTDIILSNTRVYDVDGIFVYGALLLVFCIVIVCLKKPWHIPFVLKSISLLTLIRSFFISLTHISPYPAHIAITPSIISNAPFLRSFFTGDDLFFSGHTGLPFLVALIFWDYPLIRNIFLAFSIVFAVVVLLGHLHYSIDVASAYFITYSIFCISKLFFTKDWKRSKNDEQ